MIHPKKTSEQTYPELLGKLMLQDAKEGNRREVRRYLAKGANILAVGEKGNTMLHYAAMYGWEDIAASAIEKKLAIDVKNTEGDTPLLTAARHLRSHHHSSSIIPYLLKNKANVHEKTAHGETALHFVAEGKNVALAQALLDHGADINARDRKNMTPLLHTGRGGTLEMAEWLLDKGADITLTASNPEITILHVAASKNWLSLIPRALDAKVDIEKGQPLLQAAKYGHKESVNLFLTHGASLGSQKLIPTWIPCEEETFSSDPSLLYYAAEHGWDDIVKLCLEAGASIEATNANGHTPLLIAAKHGHKEIVKLLLKKNANIKPATYSSKHMFRGLFHHFNINPDVHEHSIFGYDTLMHSAAKYGWIDIAEQCLKKTWLVFWRDGKEHQVYPLLYAAESGQKEMVLWLLEQGADMQVKDCYGRTLLHYAAKQGWKDVIERYFPASTGIMKVFSTHQLPLLEAAEHGHKTTVEWFLEHGATISSSTTGLKHTLLHYAARYGWMEIVEKCLKAGLSINVQPSSGDTPLLYAARHRNKVMVEWLLKHGADILIGDLDGTTVLHHAATHGWLDIAEKCIAARMSLEQEERRGYSPLNLAINSGQIEMVAWLIKKGANIHADNKNGLTPVEQAKATLSIEGKKMTPEKRANLHAIIAVLEGKTSTQDATSANANNEQTQEDNAKTDDKGQSQTTARKNENTTERNNRNDNSASPKNPYFLRPEKEWPESYRQAHQHFRQALAVFKEKFCSERPFSCYVIYPRGRGAITKEVTRLVGYLREAGITVHYERDRQYTHEASHDIVQKIYDVDFVIFMGHPSLLQQYSWQPHPDAPPQLPPLAKAEARVIADVMGTRSKPLKLLPVLFEKTAAEALPSLARSYVLEDLHFEHTDYFKIVFHLIEALYGLGPKNSDFKEIKKLFTQLVASEQLPQPQAPFPSQPLSIQENSMPILDDLIRNANSRNQKTKQSTLAATTITLKAAPIKDDAMESLCEVLPQFTKLTRLTISQSNLKERAMELLSERFQNLAASLTSLDLSHNPLGSSAGITALAPHLPLLQKLSFLSLKESHIDAKGVEALCNAIAKMPLLNSLDLSDNKIGEMGLKHVLRLLESVPLVTITGAADNLEERIAIDKRIKANQKSRDALFAAVVKGDLAEVERLRTQENIGLLLKNADGKTPEEVAVLHNHPNIVDYLKKALHYLTTAPTPRVTYKPQHDTRWVSEINPYLGIAEEEWPESYRAEHEAFMHAAEEINRVFGQNPPSCFVSYAWGSDSLEKEVLRLAGYLDAAGFGTVFDRNNKGGSDTHKFIQRLFDVNFIVVCGTKTMQMKSNATPENDQTIQPVVQSEIDIMEQIITKNLGLRHRFRPLVFEGTVTETLPPLLQTCIYSHFKFSNYFDILFDLIESMHDIERDDPEFIRIKKDFKAEVAAAAAQRAPLANNNNNAPNAPAAPVTGPQVAQNLAASFNNLNVANNQLPAPPGSPASTVHQSQVQAPSSPSQQQNARS